MDIERDQLHTEPGTEVSDLHRNLRQPEDETTAVKAKLDTYARQFEVQASSVLPHPHSPIKILKKSLSQNMAVPPFAKTHREAASKAHEDGQHLEHCVAC